MTERVTRPGTTISNKVEDKILYPEARAQQEAALNEDLKPKMKRLPTEEDFEGLLTPEGDSGDIVGSDVSDSTIASDSGIVVPGS